MHLHLIFVYFYIFTSDVLWVLFIHLHLIFVLFFVFVFEGVSDCCLATSPQFCSYIMARTS